MRDKKFIPIVRRVQLSDGSIISKIVGKDVIKLDVNVNPDTINALYTVAGIVTGGILIHAAVRTFK